ncbi:cI repressor-like protein [Psychrobacter phage Psymv2]|uniref:helix-turn-helix domain-containing protein n=1 Tax=Psychrobacter phage Psymv2 TaxID=1071177 RepID=UPI00022A379B|nr:helix-turn-helix domain-containing protein [Psychrobacter phage Psymv2]AEO00990.1 cI repressor-like protein [Psychrobacter phage Psymv2]
MNTLPDRLKSARERLNLSQQQVADAVGMKQPSYYQLEAGKSKRSRFINDIARVLKVDVDWLMTGEGQYEPLVNSGVSNEYDKSEYIVVGKQSDYGLVKVKYLDIKASCGSGYINEQYPETHTQAFTVEFLRSNNMSITGDGLVLMHACSDSMGYTIPHGTLMLVDTNEREFDNFVNNKVYVFQADNEMICKRAIRNLNGTVVLKSDNSDKDNYPDQTIDRDSFVQFKLFGRVRYTFAQH